MYMNCRDDNSNTFPAICGSQISNFSYLFAALEICTPLPPPPPPTMKYPDYGPDAHNIIVNRCK